MYRHILAILLGATLPTAAMAIELKSVEVELPYSDQEVPGGSEAEAINNNCRSCHSADFVLSQPNLPRAIWDAEVRKMIKVMKATISSKDATEILDYLAKFKSDN